MAEPNEPNDPEKKDLTAQTKKDTADLMGLLDELDSIIIPQLKTADKKQPEPKLDILNDSIPPYEIPLVENPLASPEMGQPASPPPILPSPEEFLPPELAIIPSTTAHPPLPDASTSPNQRPVSTLRAYPSTVAADFLETEVPTGKFFLDMQIFFKQLGRANGSRYEYWESTLSTILKILRKMQQNQQQNTELLVQAIERLHMKIKKGLQEFLIKRDEVEHYSDTDFKQMAKALKKTLELLNFQIREFKMQQTMSELYDIYVNT